MPLDPQVVAMRERRIRDGAAPLYTLPVDQARVADLASIRAGAGTPEPVHQVYDRTVPGPDGDLPIRVYLPAGEGPHPVLVYFFGGGWTVGGIETSDGICRSLSNLAGCAVVTVGYRLAPEHHFPAPVYDCHAATGWIAANAKELGVDPGRMAVGGDSAGGNLAAAVTLLVRDRGGADLVGQLLVYPNTDYLADSGSTAPRWPGTGGTTWPARRTAGTRWRPRCAPPTSVDCRRHWSSPPSTTRSGTRERRTRPASPRPASRSS